jgi:hypothetical protein
MNNDKIDMNLEYKKLNVIDGKKYARELFFNAFKCEIPNFPLHFILQVEINRKYETVGYVHFTEHDHNSYLCGGLVINARIFRRLEKEQRSFIKTKCGFAEILLRESFAQLGTYDVIWGYVGNKLAEKVDLRVGFVKTHRQYIIAVWHISYSDKEKFQLGENIYRIGPF